MNSDQISNNKIRQVFMLAVIIILSAIILYNLSDFLPSLLGAITLYIISRSWNFKLVEEKGWKPWVAALVIILICLVIIVIPTYFTIEVLVNKISDAKAYTESITQFFEKIETYIRAKTGFEILSNGNLEKITGFATKASTAILNTTVNMISVIVGMFFILYFMLTKGRLFERILTSISPLKKANDQKIGEKFRKMVIANAVTQGFQPFSSTSLKFQLLEIIYNVMAPNKEGKKSLRLYNIIAERMIMTANMKT